MASAAKILAITLSSLTLADTAHAQGLFDFLFNPFRRPPPSNSYVDPNAGGLTQDPSRSGQGSTHTSGGGGSYCVRLCDGRYFPVASRRGASAAETCSALCPATPTKVFSGGTIDNAYANDGRSYKDLPAAFSYRSSVVANCTCNGQDPFGLAKIEAEKDPTLQPGDIVATGQGFVVATPGRQRMSFTPLKGEMRAKLLAVRITPAAGSRRNDAIAGDIRIRAGNGVASDSTARDAQDAAGSPRTAVRIVGGTSVVPPRTEAAATDGQASR